MTVTGDPEPAASGAVQPNAAEPVPPASAGAAPGQPAGTRRRSGPGLGERLFRASIGPHSGKLAVAFGADGTLVVTEQNGAIHRWSLSRGGAELPGAPDEGPAPVRTDFLYGAGTQVAVSTVVPAVAVARGARVTIVHFTDGGYRTSVFPLGRMELMVADNGVRFATWDRRRMAVRDFADGAVAWEQPCPHDVVTAAVDMRGTTVAMAYQTSSWAPGNRFVVASRDDGRPREFAFGNLRVPGAGCRLGLSPDGELAVCASFREILLARPATGEIVARRRITSVREEIVPSLGLRPHRLICLPDGQVLWMRGRRVVDVNWAGEKFRYLPQDGLCDDIAFDHANSRLAMVSESGQVEVFEWRRP